MERVKEGIYLRPHPEEARSAVSKDEGGPRPILRDARKSALLRMRSEYVEGDAKG
jgi:hypothetical protein